MIRALFSVLALCLLLLRPAGLAAGDLDGLTGSGTAGPQVSGSLKLDLPGGGQALAARVKADLMVMGPGDYALDLSLTDFALSLPWLSGRATGDCRLRLQGNFLFLEEASLSLRDVSLNLTGRPIELSTLTLEAQGEYSLADGSLKLTRIKGNAPGLASLSGFLALSPDAGPSGNLSLDIEELPKALAMGLPEIAGLVSGGSLSADLSLGPAVKLDLRSHGLALSLGAGEPRLAELSASADLSRNAAKIEAAFKWSDAPSGLALEATASQKSDSAYQGSAVLRKSGETGEDILALTGSASTAPDGSLLRLSASLTAEDREAGEAEISGPAPYTGRITTRDLPLNVLFKLAGALDPTQVQGLEDWLVEGGLDADLALARTGGADEAAGTEVVKVTAGLKAHGLSLASPDGKLMAQNIELTLNGQTASTAPRPVSLAARVIQGEMLYGTTYANFSAIPLTFGVRGLVHQDGLLEVESADFDLGQMLQLHGQGRHQGEESQGRIRLVHADLAALYAGFVRDPLALEAPSLSASEARGTASARVDFTRRGAVWDLSGRVDLAKAGFLSGPDRADAPAVRDIDLAMPFSYRLGAAPDRFPMPPLAEGWGTLSVGEIVAGPLLLSFADKAVALVPNRLFLGGRVAANLYGGELALSEIFVDEPLSAAPAASFILALKAIDFSRLPSEKIPLKGELSGILNRVTATPKRVDTRGVLRGTFFGGDLTISDIFVREPLSSSRTVGLNASAGLVHLDELSRALDIGRITGRLDVGLTGFRLAYGQPVAFDLRAESRRVPGVDQMVSLKAVESITRIGTGNPLTGAGLGIFASFFKEFPYRGIGFACELKNDLFRIQGLIHEGGVEYIIKRPLLYGVDVVNSNTNNTIRFSDMLERIGRVVGASGPKTSETAPQTGKEVP